METAPKAGKPNTVYQRPTLKDLTENVPAELRALDQWVAWREEPPRSAGAKPTKVPVNPVTLQNAKSNDPTTWSSFPKALKAYCDHAQMLAGIGFALSEKDLYTGVDLDKCRDPKTGIIDSWAVELIRRFNSYTEVSPSRTGVKLIVRGSLGDRDRHFVFQDHEVEIYDCGRYLALTGLRLPDTPAEIRDAQAVINEIVPIGMGKNGRPPVWDPATRPKDAATAAVDALTDAELIERIMKSKQGAKFKALMNDDKNGYPGYFAASTAFCTILASWTRLNPERIDRIYRTGKMFEEGWWDGPYSHGLTYAQKIIPDACAYAVSGWLYDPLSGQALARVKAVLDGTDTMTALRDLLPYLAALDPLDYTQFRKAIAKRYSNARPGVIDKEVSKLRDEASEEVELQGEEAEFSDIIPWDDPVPSLSELLDEVSQTLKRHVFFKRPEDADTVALWSLMTHSYPRDCFRIAPYLRVSSPIEECGKTTLLKIISELVYRPVNASNITPASVFRVVQKYRPTLIIDELDTFLDKSPEFVGILNSGHDKKMGFVYRCVGDDQEVRKFCTYGPKAYGMIGSPVGTFASRSITIQLIRKKPDEKIEEFDDENPAIAEKFEKFRRKITRWVNDHVTEVKSYEPDASGLGNRARDNWKPLLTFAELAGPEWKKRALIAAGLVDTTAKENVRKILLRDIRNIFHTRKAMWIATKLLVSDLNLQRDSPWPTYEKNRDGLNEHQLGNLLKDFGVEHTRQRATQIPLEGKALPSPLRWGYALAEFTGLFDRLLQGESADEETEVSHDHF